MAVDILIQFPMPRFRFQRLWDRLLVKQKVDQIAGFLPAYENGFAARHAIDDYISNRHFGRPFDHLLLHLISGDFTPKTVAAACASCSGVLGFDESDVHSLQQDSDRAMDSLLIAGRAGVDDGHGLAVIIGKWEGVIFRKNFPQ